MWIIVLPRIHDIATLGGSLPQPAHDSGWIRRLLLGKPSIETSGTDLNQQGPGMWCWVTDRDPHGRMPKNRSKLSDSGGFLFVT